MHHGHSNKACATYTSACQLHDTKCSVLCKSSQRSAAFPVLPFSNATNITNDKPGTAQGNLTTEWCACSFTPPDATTTASNKSSQSSDSRPKNVCSIIAALGNNLLQETMPPEKRNSAKAESSDVITPTSNTWTTQRARERVLLLDLMPKTAPSQCRSLLG